MDTALNGKKEITLFSIKAFQNFKMSLNAKKLLTFS